MKKKYILCMVLCLVCMMTGCGNTETRDTYVAGTDFQYQNLSDYVNYKAQGKDCLYCVIGNYIYQYDEKSGILSPLCNKTNCLHDREKDESRLEDCNAYISDDASEVGVQYMDGYIYSVMQEYQENELCSVLYRIAEDGSDREKVYQWDGAVVESWCMHRGNAYVLEHCYSNEEGETYKVQQISISGHKKAIFEPEEGVTVYAFGALTAYGNHLYINVSGALGDNVDELNGEEWYKYEYNKTFQYNIQDESLTEIQTPHQKETEHVLSVTFWKDKIVFAPSDSKTTHQYDVTTDVYIADLDGANAAVLLKDMPSYRMYSSDGNYLYVSDCSEALDKIYHSSEYQKKIQNGEKIKAVNDFIVHIDVYDKEMQLVDRMESPFKNFPNELPYGIGDREYALIENDAGDGKVLKYWDKTKIGTYQGNIFEYIEVAEQKYSVYNMQMMETGNEDE